MSRRRQPIDCGNCVIQSILQCLATRNPSTVESANTVSYRRPISPPRHNILYQVLRDRRQTAIADRFDWMPDVGPDPWTHCIPKSVELVSYQNLNNITDSLFSKDASNALPLSLPLSSVLKRYFVKGTVKGKLVAALPDNGAGLCFISKAMLLGNKSERLWGSFDYKTTAAFPDTGSDAMFVSKEYAEKLDLEIDNDIKSQIEVELGDGTTTWTSGIVRDVSWIVGGMGVRCDFHILDNLCVDVVLSNDYLFEYKIFLKYKKYLVDNDMEEDHSQLCSIRLIGRYGESLDLLEQEYLDDGKQVSPHGLLMMVLDSLTVLNHSERP
ncbi:hypothetical protein EIK77_007119 [Talaromyces pinophilus]|nr:hypothetical protein EIK77_007119 [Talaromyces pinophilus]